MKKALTLTLALLLVVSSICFAETEIIEEVPMDVEIVVEEDAVEPLALCNHPTTATRTEVNKDCIVSQKQDITYCTKCGNTLSIGEPYEHWHGKHLGPVVWETVKRDNKEVRVKICQNCLAELEVRE